MRSQRELFSEDLLLGRLRVLGLPNVAGIETHENRSVMVSVTAAGVLRVHRAYAYASDAVLAAIVTFTKPYTRRDRRQRALRTILTFPVHEFATTKRPPRRRSRTHPGDRGLVRELLLQHGSLNDRFFESKLSRIPLRVSRRMKRRLGEVSLNPDTGRPIDLAISREHIQRDGWTEVEQTLLHEMVHQWQAENALSVDHGAMFRRKAREIGIEPRATRDLRHARR